MNIKHKIVILGIIENSQGQILVTQRIDPEIQDAHMKWDIVGGTKRNKESEIKTLKRECIEETGYKITINKKLSKNIIKKWNHAKYTLVVDIRCYHCNALQKTINKTADKKVNKIEWKPKKEMLSLDLLPTTRELIKYFFEHSVLI